MRKSSPGLSRSFYEDWLLDQIAAMLDPRVAPGAV
jgi:hypothetical protein